MTSVAYVDSSILVAIAFRESGWQDVNGRLGQFESVLSTNLLEAEVRAAHARSGVSPSGRLFADIKWVYPDRQLTAEFKRVEAAGYLRGADLWHLATALFIAEDPGDITFLTLDSRQAHIAGALGFVL